MSWFGSKTFQMSKKEEKKRAPQCSPDNFLAAGRLEHGPSFFFAQMLSRGLQHWDVNKPQPMEKG